MGIVIVALLVIAAIDIVLLTSRAEEPVTGPAVHQRATVLAGAIGYGYLVAMSAFQFSTADRDSGGIACRAFPQVVSGRHAPESAKLFSCVIPTSVN